MTKGRFIAFFIFISASVVGQTKVLPEEIAFRHLLQLIQNDSRYKDLKFRANGFIEDHKVSDLDTIFCKIDLDSQIIKNPLGENILVIERKIKSFKLPDNYKDINDHKPVSIYQYFKHNDFYYVLMNFKSDDYSGYNLTMILNSKGDLVTECLTEWVE